VEYNLSYDLKIENLKGNHLPGQCFQVKCLLLLRYFGVGEPGVDILGCLLRREAEVVELLRHCFK
jgi:hypothetical protein